MRTPRVWATCSKFAALRQELTSLLAWGFSRYNLDVEKRGFGFPTPHLSQHCRETDIVRRVPKVVWMHRPRPVECCGSPGFSLDIVAQGLLLNVPNCGCDKRILVESTWVAYDPFNANLLVRARRYIYFLSRRSSPGGCARLRIASSLRDNGSWRAVWVFIGGLRACSRWTTNVIGACVVKAAV